MRCSLFAFAVVLLAACRDTSAPSVTNEAPPAPLPASVASLALVQDIPVNGGIVTMAGSMKAPTAFASLVGHDAFSVDVDAIERSIVGRFTPGKVRVTFNLRVRNRLRLTRFIPPTFPAPPDDANWLYLFAAHAAAIETPGGVTVPVSNVVEVWAPSRGAVSASSDWDGTLYDYVHATRCNSGSTCARYERFASPLDPDQATAWRRVGFDVDPTVRFIRLRLVLAADLVNVPR